MIRRPPRSTRTDTLFPYTTLFRPYLRVDIGHACDYAQSIDGLSRDFKFCARHPRLGNINQLRKGTKGRVGPADELLIAIIIIECRSEEHTSELQSLMRISYAVFCLKKKTIFNILHTTI